MYQLLAANSNAARDGECYHRPRAAFRQVPECRLVFPGRVLLAGELFDRERSASRGADACVEPILHQSASCLCLQSAFSAIPSRCTYAGRLCSPRRVLCGPLQTRARGIEVAGSEQLYAPAHVENDSHSFVTRTFYVRYVEEVVQLNDLVHFRMELVSRSQALPRLGCMERLSANSFCALPPCARHTSAGCGRRGEPDDPHD